ncbi:MAG: hypothetical protein AB7S38_16400 [Vulcanimicrobiota bacterium]
MEASQLLKRAMAIYDDPASGLAQTASQAGRQGFLSGAQWMNQALGVVRGRPTLMRPANYQGLGFFKYGLATAAALTALFVAYQVGRWDFLGLVPLAFYAVEAQFVFLFPLVLDGSPTPVKDSLALTARAGGTIQVMATVVPIACVMLFGGFVGQGFVRCWCVGCLAVVLWYEDVLDI